MINKIVAIIVVFVIIHCLSHTITLGSYLFNKKKEGANITKDIGITLLTYVYVNYLKSNILYEGNYKKSKNKVDVIIGNHINTLDFVVFASIIRIFDNRPIYFVFKKQVIFYPMVGFPIGSNLDIKLNRKLEEDIDNINEAVNEINDGIIIIMPEGTRFTPEKHLEAIKYSKDNNLPIFKNTLYPKMKGIFIISNILNKNNRLGNIIDITIQINKFKNKKAYLNDLLKEDFGDTYCIINTYSIPKKVFINYDIFKNWFINKIWIKKEMILDTIHDTNLHKYNEFKPIIKSYEYFLILIIITLFFYLTMHTNGLYIPVSLIISYSLMYFLYKKISKL